jgi:SanA protein
MKRILRFIERLIVLGIKIAMVGGLVAILLPLGLRAATALAYRARTYTTETVPERTAALVFGARVYANGRPSAMLADRVATGVDLYHAGKVDLLIMTGSTDGERYSEPRAMRDYAVSLGVPASAIIMDDQGVRTYASCHRAKHVYHVDEAILVTQNFHLDRALLLCNAMGVDSVGVWADYQRPWGYSQHSLNYSRIREIPATLVALLDVIRRPDPLAG